MPRKRRAGLFVILRRLLLLSVVASIAVVLCLRWIPPPTSAFMIERQLGDLFSGRRSTPLHYRWLPWQAMPRSMALAVIAAEDQKFPYHLGFDVNSILKAAENNTETRVRGASTISQQVAKNLFLWPGRSYLRKGLEAYFTLLLELLWPKGRILEVYLNIAEFGDGVYGVSAAAEVLFRKRPAQLSTFDASTLAAVLPNPKLFDAKHPSPYVRERSGWIRRQMAQLGGTNYLGRL
ncbi:MAG: monofunctional biosynthetic peptidoglycan transglycosylase [Porticoccaceae bacterium]